MFSFLFTFEWKFQVLICVVFKKFNSLSNEEFINMIKIINVHMVDNWTVKRFPFELMTIAEWLRPRKNRSMEIIMV